MLYLHLGKGTPPRSNQCTLAYPCHCLDLTVRAAAVEQLQCMIYLSGSIFFRSALVITRLCASHGFSGLCAFNYHSTLKLGKSEKHGEYKISRQRVLNKAYVKNMNLYSAFK